MSSNNTKTGLKQRTCITLAALLAVLAQGADAATQTHTATFNGAGGDAQVGYGATADPTYNLAVYDVLPLFDAGLGTLERVSYTLSGWRSFDGVCSSPVYAENPGACSARIDGAFYLEAMNLNAWPQTVAMADIRPLITELTQVWPPIGGALPINLDASDSAGGEITDAGLLGSFFTESGLANHGINLRFSPQDSGYWGQGGGAGFSAMLWDADATVTMNYHYTPTVPETGAAALLLAGLGVLALRARRQKL